MTPAPPPLSTHNGACSPVSSRNCAMRSIAPVPAGLEGLAQSLIRNDCQAQLDVLIDTVAVPSTG